MDLSKLMEQAQKLQQAQSDLSSKTAEAKDPSGKIIAVANGAGELQSLSIDPTIISADDSDFLQDLILSTCNTALKTARDEAAQDMAANLNIPGLG